VSGKGVLKFPTGQLRLYTCVKAMHVYFLKMQWPEWSTKDADLTKKIAWKIDWRSRLSVFCCIMYNREFV